MSSAFFPFFGLAALDPESWTACSSLAYAYTSTVLSTTAAVLEALLGAGEGALGQVHLTQGPGYIGLSVWF